MKKLWDLKKVFSNLELEGQGRGIIMGVTTTSARAILHHTDKFYVLFCARLYQFCFPFMGFEIPLPSPLRRHRLWMAPNLMLIVNKVCTLHCMYQLKYGFYNKSFILNAPLVSCPIPVIRSGWVQQQTHPKPMTGIGQLTRGAFRIKDLLWNPHFKYVVEQY